MLSKAVRVLFNRRMEQLTNVEESRRVQLLPKPAITPTLDYAMAISLIIPGTRNLHRLAISLSKNPSC